MEKQIAITLEQAIYLFKTNKELRPMLLNAFTLKELENKDIKFLKEVKSVDMFYIDYDSQILYIRSSETWSSCSLKKENIK